MKIQLVILDMAGTTIRDDDAVNRCLREALALAGIRVRREQVNAVMGLPKPVAIAHLLVSCSAEDQPPSAARVEKLHADFLALMLHFYQTDPAVAPMPGAEECFRTLKRAGVRVALDTGFSRPIADALLRRLGWHAPGLLDATVTSDEVLRGRPHPDLVLAAMQRTGVGDSKRVAKVGDTPADLQEGTAAGCGLVVGITHGTHTRAELHVHPHTHLSDHLAELPPLILAPET